MEEFVDHSTIHGLQYLKAPKRWDYVQRQKLTFSNSNKKTNSKKNIYLSYSGTVFRGESEATSFFSSDLTWILFWSDLDFALILPWFDPFLTMILPWFEPDLNLIQHWPKTDITLTLLLRSYPERIFWLLACICAFVIGTYLIYRVIDKSITSPVLVSFDGCVNC